MWNNKRLGYISSIGWLHVVQATGNPVIVRDMNVSQHKLERRHMSQKMKGALFITFFS